MSLLATPPAASLQLTFSRVRVWTVLGGTALLNLLGLWLLVRRLTIVERAPLDGGALVVTAVALAAYAASLRLLWPKGQFPQLFIRVQRWGDRLPAMGLVLVGASLMLPGTSAVAVIGFWATLLAAELLVPHVWAHWAPTMTVPGLPRPQPAREPSPPVRNGDAAPDVTLEPEERLRHNVDVIQQLTRRQSAEGAAAMEAWLRADFAPGQRMATLHVAFCPPFGRRPEVYVEAVSGPESTPRVMQVLPTGARVDVRLPRTSPVSTHVGIQLIAEVPPDNA